MSDDVSVAELLEREGWKEEPRTPRSRLQVMAVMLAVVLGCGLAAILVKVGADSQAEDTDSTLFSLPAGPTGGLAGGGVPEGQNSTQRTNSSSQVVVTNEPPGAGAVIPWGTKSRTTTRTETVTVTDSNTPPTTGGPPDSTNPGQTGTATGGTTTGPSTTTRTEPSCVLLILCRP